jgi:carboxypeptidase T
MKDRLQFITSNRLFWPVLLIVMALLVAGGTLIVLNRQERAASQGDDTSLVLRVYFKDRAERDRLAAELAPEEAGTTGGYLTVISDRDAYESMKARGLSVEIDAEQVRQQDEVKLLAQSNPGLLFGDYRTVDEVYAYMDRLAAAHPTLVEKVDIGDSWCKTHPGECTQPDSHEGYDLYVLHITNRDIPGPKPVFWLDAGTHSREIAGPEMATRFMGQLLDRYDRDPDSRWLVDWHDIWIMPLVNPDGYRLVGPDSDRPMKHRKNADNDDGCEVYPSTSDTQFGTDINRNFPYKWGCCKGSSTDACEQDYRGPESASEPETQALTSQLAQLFPDQRGSSDADRAPITTTGIYQALHSYGSLNLIPWGWTDRTAPNGKDLLNIGNHMRAGNAFPRGNGYEACRVGDCLYLADGGSIDWLYGTRGLASFSTELGDNGFFPPYSNMPRLWNENKGMLTYMAKLAGAPYLLTKGPDADNLPTTLTAEEAGTAQLSGRINYNWQGNAYRQNVAAAELYIDTPPWAGGTPIPMTATDGSFNSATEAVSAEISTADLSRGRHIVFVRGRGVNSYEGYESWGPVTGVFLDVP